MALQLAFFTVQALPRPLNLSTLPFPSAASTRGISAALPPPPAKQCHRRILAEIHSSENRLLFSRCFEAAMVALAFSAVASDSASASGLPLLDPSVLSREPSNALSLPTWAIHISSVAEWVAAMALVWEYGEKSGFESWKGLSWGMVPLLGGALCACTWHFFYNSESLDAWQRLDSKTYPLRTLEEFVQPWACIFFVYLCMIVGLTIIIVMPWLKTDLLKLVF